MTHLFLILVRCMSFITFILQHLAMYLHGSDHSLPRINAPMQQFEIEIKYRRSLYMHGQRWLRLSATILFKSENVNLCLPPNEFSVYRIKKFFTMSLVSVIPTKRRKAWQSHCTAVGYREQLE